MTSREEESRIWENDNGRAGARRRIIIGVLVVGGLLSGCSDEPEAAVTTTQVTTEPAQSTEPAQTTEITVTTELDRLAQATERIRSAECWQKLNDRVNWTSDYIEFDLEGSDDGQFIEDRLDVLEGDMEGCDASTAVEELTGAECPRLTDMVTDLEEAETVASENPDHPWTPDLEAIVSAEHEALAAMALDAGCDA